MEPEDWPKIKSIFDSVILLGKNERTAHLEIACANDVDLRREVEALLASFEVAHGFMEKPFAVGVAGSLLEREADELEPGDVFNRYRIEQKIGVGGIGTVYLALDTDLKRSVALKLLCAAATYDPDQVKRFIQEARLASLLNHPNILTIYEIGRVRDLHFISTEYVPGETLRERLKRETVSPREAVDIGIDVASALVVAHRADILHRDIKPENIMIRDDGLLKVLDFGLAKLHRHKRLATETWNDVRTAPGLIMGTVNYMSPEQAGGLDVDARTDVWSLGVVLYEMIMGRPPFDGSSAAGVVAAILREEPQLLNYSSADVPRRLRQVIQRSLSRTPEDRYQTMQEMLDDLKKVQADIAGVGTEARSIAILPFVNLTRDPAMSFFEFALADAVITELARSPSLCVRPSSSVAKYVGQAVDPLEVGKTLKVDAILAANFLISKKRIRVTTQLIDVAEKIVLWGEQIDADADDIIELEDLITQRIVEGLNCELGRSTSADVAMPATSNSLAYMEYLRGRDQLRRYMFHTVANENVAIAIEHFKRAIDLDPAFALAHCALGISFLQRVVKVEGNRADLDAAAVSLDNALALDPEIVEAAVYRSFITRLNGETQKSRDQLSELRRRAPNTFEVHYLSAACFRFDGDYENSFRSLAEMLRIDPTAQVAVHYCRARLYWYRGYFDFASRELASAEKLEPNHRIVKFFQAILTFRLGGPSAAVKELRDLFRTHPSRAFRPVLSMCLSAAGEREAALRELDGDAEEIAEVDPDVSYWLASANSLLGRPELAFKWLERSIQLGNHNLPWFERDPVLALMRDDPRFEGLLSGLRQR